MVFLVAASPKGTEHHIVREMGKQGNSGRMSKSEREIMWQEGNKGVGLATTFIILHFEKNLLISVKPTLTHECDKTGCVTIAASPDLLL